jgi:hypothetical protein
MFWKAYLNVMHTIILENYLLCSLGFCLRDFDKHRLHGLWRTQLKVTQDVMQI